MSSLQEQYEFLHHALVHTLTLACAQIPADTFPQYMIKTSAAEFAQQFKASPNFFCTLGVIIFTTVCIIKLIKGNCWF